MSDTAVSFTELTDKDDRVYVFSFPIHMTEDGMEHAASHFRSVFDHASCVILQGELDVQDEAIAVHELDDDDIQAILRNTGGDE